MENNDWSRSKQLPPAVPFSSLLAISRLSKLNFRHLNEHECSVSRCPSPFLNCNQLLYFAKIRHYLWSKIYIASTFCIFKASLIYVSWNWWFLSIFIWQLCITQPLFSAGQFFFLLCCKLNWSCFVFFSFPYFWHCFYCICCFVKSHSLFSSDCSVNIVCSKDSPMIQQRLQLSTTIITTAVEK